MPKPDKWSNAVRPERVPERKKFRLSARRVTSNFYVHFVLIWCIMTHMGQTPENTPLLIAWKALSTLAIIAVMAWYGSTFVAHDHVNVATHLSSSN
jgi:hypothetical protein